MPVRIYDIAKKLGIESKEVLAKAKELGITGAKVPSSSLDKITAQYLEEQFGGAKPVASVQTGPSRGSARILFHPAAARPKIPGASRRATGAQICSPGLGRDYHAQTAGRRSRPG